MNQVADPDQELPAYDLPSKILCRVVNIQLKVTFAAVLPSNCMLLL